MTAPRSKRTPSTTRALNQWRLEAIESRDTLFILREKIGEARARICEAIEALGQTGPGTHEARTRLIEALDALVLKGRDL